MYELPITRNEQPTPQDDHACVPTVLLVVLFQNPSSFGNYFNRIYQKKFFYKRTVIYLTVPKTDTKQHAEILEIT